MHRSIFVISAFQSKGLSVRNGELLLTDTETGKTLTKMPFQKILALIVIGSFTLSSAVLEKCTAHAVAIVLLKQNLRPIMVHAPHAEANFLLRKQQFSHLPFHFPVARQLVANKTENQIAALKATRRRDSLTLNACTQCGAFLNDIETVQDPETLMGMDGRCAKMFFAAFYQDMEWKGRFPRTKQDPLNVCLDLGYSMLFNWVDVMLRLFGFDPYIGVYHRLWFKRKSLVCDLMEPLRPIVDRTVLKAFHLKQFSYEHFALFKGQYTLSREFSSSYYRLFSESFMRYKTEIFLFVRGYYRAIMKNPDHPQIPHFVL